MSDETNNAVPVRTSTWRSLVSKLPFIGKAAAPGEGAYRPPPYFLPISGGFLGSEGASVNFWQRGYDVRPLGTSSAMVEACVSAYAQTVAMCPGDHWRKNNKGGRDRVTTSALCRILRQPNDYQSISDFLLNAVRHLYLDGNAYALCVRNDRYEISELHLMQPRTSWPQVDPEGGIWYQLGGNFVIERRLGPEAFAGLFPARDVLHIRLHTDLQRYNMLIGETPLWAAAMDIATSDAVKAQQLAFFANQARPSFVLSTDLLLDKDQVEAVRQRWDDMSQGLNAGKTPILTGGLKPQTLTVRSRDSQLAEVMKMTDQDVALAFRVPMAILGLGGAPHGATEALMQEWIASGLGFCLNHIEEAIGNTFGLKGQPEEYVEFDTSVLLRSLFKDRIAALKEGVTGGIFSPNEARNLEGLPDVKFGDEPRMQQQQVPLSAAAAIPAGTPAGSKTIMPSQPPAPPAPGQPGQPGIKPKPEAAGPPRSPTNARDINSSRVHSRSLRYQRSDRLRDEQRRST